MIRKLRTLLLNDTVYRLALLVLAALFCMRVFNLESDLPNFGMALYQPFDEGSYSRMSLNYLHYGSFDNADGYAISTGDTFKALFVGNMLQIASFTLFGNNYFGSRLPYVFCAGLTLLLICLVVRKAARTYGASKAVERGAILAVGLIVVSSFPFLMMSRVVESSNIRALGTAAVMVVVYYLADRPRIKYFALGFLSVTLIFFVYFSNLTPLFAVCALFLFLVVKRDFRCVKLLVMYGGLGVVAGLLVSEAYYLLVWGQEAVSTLISGTVGSFGERAIGLDGSSDGLLLRMIKGGIAFFDSNMFFYDVPLLVATIVSLCFNAALAWRARDERLAFVVLLVVGMLLQSVFTNDYIERKAIVVYPACIVSIAVLVFTFRDEWLGSLNRWSARKKTVLSVFVFVLTVFVLYTSYRFRDSKSYLADYSDTGLGIVFYASLIELALIGLALAVFARGGRARHAKYSRCARKVVFASCAAAVVCAFLVNNVFSIHYYYLHDSYTEKSAMVEIGDVVGSSYVTDPYAYSMSLYNDIKPISSAGIEPIRELFAQDGIDYLIDYSHPGILVRDIDVENRTEIIATYERNFSQLGIKKTIAVYKKTN